MGLGRRFAPYWKGGRRTPLDIAFELGGKGAHGTF